MMRRILAEEYVDDIGGPRRVGSVFEDVDEVEAKATRAAELRAAVWNHVDSVLDAREREALAAQLQRCAVTIALGGTVDGEAMTLLVAVLNWADAALAAWIPLREQVAMAATWEELQAVQFNPASIGTPPAVTAADIAARMRGG